MRKRGPLSETPFPLAKKPLRKLFKNPISERWGKQICLN